MRAKCFTLLLLQFPILFQFIESVDATKKMLPLWDLNEPAPTETEEEQQSSAVIHSQNVRLNEAVDIAASQTGKESDCEIHHQKCKHWKYLTKKEKVSSKNKRYRKNAVSRKRSVYVIIHTICSSGNTSNSLYQFNKSWK